MIRRSSDSRRRFLAPEVVQTSAMDCGPASLKCLLEGFGIQVSYGRLREACQTDVDGTSIDTMEEVAGQLGLAAEQIMVPKDHLLGREADLLPAIVVVRLSNGLTHFVVAWRSHGPLIQLMDPGTGRRWSSKRQFLEDVYIHEMEIPARQWLDWANTEDLHKMLSAQLAHLGMSKSQASRHIRSALDRPGWHSIASLDAAARMVASLVQSGGLHRGSTAVRVLEQFAIRAQDEGDTSNSVIPTPYWMVRSVRESEEKLILRGAVLVRVHRRLRSQVSRPAEKSRSDLSPDLATALEETPSRPGRELLRLLRSDGWFAPSVLAAAVLLAASGVVIEALLFRSLFDIGRNLGLTGQRLGAIGALLLFLAGYLLLEVPIKSSLLRLGRKLEMRLRAAFLAKIPRLGDRYFHSRLTSDMAMRSHSVHQIRLLPELGEQLLRGVFQMVLTTAGIAWLDPASSSIALLAAVLAVGLPLAAQPVLMERDLRVRSHGGALSRYYMDALLGLGAIRTHGAERALRREHEGLLVEWARSGLRLQLAVVAAEGIQFLIGFGLAAWLLLNHVGHGTPGGSVLLLVYWALSLPVLGQDILLVARQYPADRNLTLRLLEPLGAPDETQRPQSAESSTRLAEPAREEQAGGVSIVFGEVNVRAAGHAILKGINLTVGAGEHVAIVGHSGAGKSSLVGILLGWHRPTSGQVFIDGMRLEGALLDRLRRETAWVDPTVHLWNRSLLDNLFYGISPDTVDTLDTAVEATDLRSVLERLPGGFRTILGESGGLISGGEGQRVRLARAILRPGVRLAILDEPFRGLDRERRRELLDRVRSVWRRITLLCITHDVAETKLFDRVVVVEGGRIAEDDTPQVLAARPGSRYRALLEAEESVRIGMWSSGDWRRLRMREGRLNEIQDI